MKRTGWKRPWESLKSTTRTKKSPGSWIRSHCCNKIAVVKRLSIRGNCLIFVLALNALVSLSAAGKPCLKPVIREINMQETESFLIDDFSNEKEISALGTEWRLFTDRVMGGVSDATFSIETIEGRRCLHVRGRVSLKNNGGFIQVALPLTRDNRQFDASRFKGIRVWARGNGKTYHIHLRTSQTRLPWQYYSAAFAAGNTWQVIELPFEWFKPENLKAQIDVRDLERIAIVAIGEEMDADVYISRLEFYR